ncbi:helix-turn-helix transcriptional regulator [Plantactinospora sp. S1510]|uniref:Helix-turn-helix transcriptional regulator n=1 Tax=Plantactinospora alkalitolerans TaxID=2789879 RepID=A0ABS0H8T3_9ACTN|nr:PadR family transcriptional regulator [Plantactinospora alkalitolerans]MBF9134891.1 helix-turn-helix transcriptional regulator [Plantactinospora alkalitolerans]
MTTVFGHGRLRLYLLKLLDGGPRHGYELIRLLEEKFLGLYAPSAGTIYPRLQRLEAEGLVTHNAVGGRKIYRITEAGRAELRQRADEVATLESEIHASVSDLAKLAGDIRTELRGSVHDLRQELRAAARELRRGDRESGPSGAYPRSAAGNGRPGGERPAAGGSGGGRPRTGEPGEDADPVDEFERHLIDFVAEVRALADSRRFSEAQLRTAARLLHGALDGLRRLLR